MNLIILLFNVLTIFNLNNIIEDNFIDEVEVAYEEYALIEEYSNVYYNIQLYAGKINGKVYYGLRFHNEIPNEYKIRIRINNKEHEFKRTPRGDFAAVGLNLKKSKEFSIMVYNKNNIYQQGHLRFKDIKVINSEEFASLSNIKTGQGEGVSLTNLHLTRSLALKVIIYITLFSIFTICIVVILWYYKLKKGLFNEDIKSNNVFNFKKFIEEEFNDVEDNVKDEFDLDESIFELDENDYSEVVEENTTQTNNQINSAYIWSRYEEEKSHFDLKEHFKSKGLNYNYNLLSEDDKNKIMLELIYLKDNKIITQDDYLNEVGKLWKK